jgi:hypothetical protein
MLDRLPSSARLWVAAALAVACIVALALVIMRSTRPEEGPPAGFNPATAVQDNMTRIQNNPNIPPDVKARAMAGLQQQQGRTAAMQQAAQAQAKAADAQGKK